MSQTTQRKLFAFASYFILATVLLAYTLGAQYFIIHSSLPLDFENLLELSIESYSFLGAIILGFLGLFYGTYLFTVYAQRWEPKPIWRVGAMLSVGLTTYVLFKAIHVGPPASTAALSISIFLLLADVFINPPKKNLTYLISWVIVISAFIAMVFFNAYVRYDILKREKLAASLYHTFDATKLADINELHVELKDHEVFNNILSVPFPFKVHREEFREIARAIFKNHEKSNKYIFNAYDKRGNAMLYETYTPLSYYEDFLDKSFQIDEHTYYDPIKNIYLKKWIYDAPHHQNAPFVVYLEQLPIGKSANSLLYSQVVDDYLGKFNYVFYHNKKLKSYSSPHTVHTTDHEISVGKGESQLVTQYGYSDLYYGIDDVNMIKLSRKAAKLIKPISLFSFIFLFIALLIGVVGLANSRLKWLPYSFSLEFQKGSSLRNKLQLSIIVITIVSFFIIGLVTIFYFQNLSGEYDQDVLREKTIAMAIDMESQTSHLNKVSHAVSALSQSLSQLTAKHHMDINVYSVEGDLLLSSIPKVYEMKQREATLQPKILKAFQANKNLIKLEIKSNEYSDSYQQAYFPILNTKNDISVIVQSLHPPSLEANSKVSDFVGTLLNVYVFLFLLATSIALAVSNSITRPLVQLGNKLKSVKLGSHNEKLQWNSSDELGQLVSNYNNMVSQLDDSAKLLARTERDLAWREMARQVAHEIKNPLTPMKLNIQYLLRAKNQDSRDMNDMIERVSNTLIEQIDNLTGIANAFSNFGKMPQAENNKVVLNEVVEAVHLLFKKRDDIDFNMYQPIDDMWVYADKNHLIRILNNIIKNAIQAIPIERRGAIEIRLYRESKNAVISVKDNGSGIPDDMKEKVFSPYFTTKNSGTGLGLAICSNMVESFNGRLHFTTELNKGTTFFIEIPLLLISDNFEEVEHILLEA